MEERQKKAKVGKGRGKQEEEEQRIKEKRRSKVGCKERFGRREQIRLRWRRSKGKLR